MANKRTVQERIEFHEEMWAVEQATLHMFKFDFPLVDEQWIQKLENRVHRRRQLIPGLHKSK